MLGAGSLHQFQPKPAAIKVQVEKLPQFRFTYGVNQCFIFNKNGAFVLLELLILNIFY